MKKVEVTVYETWDGHRFFTEEECLAWEKLLEAIKFFRVKCNPDLTETGCFLTIIPVAVYTSHYVYAKSIVENFLVKELNMPILGEGVQGYGFQPHFEIVVDEWKDFFSFQVDQRNESYWWGKKRYLLTESEIGVHEPFFEGLPDLEIFNFKEKWNFK